MTYSYTETAAFTVTHARHLAAKIATDLKRMQRLYDEPDDEDIEEYQAEAIEFVRAGYLESVAYGFKRDGRWIEPTLIYTIRELLGASADDDDPGRVRPGADVAGGYFHSFLQLNQAWWNLPLEERARFEENLPFKRTPGTEPGVNGCLVRDRTYSSGGRALERSSVRGF